MKSPSLLINGLSLSSNSMTQAHQWLKDFWGSHEPEDCQHFLWGLLSNSVSAQQSGLGSEHSLSDLFYFSEQLSLLLCCTHEIYAPKPLAPSGCFVLPPDSPPELRSILQNLVSLVEVDQIFLLGSYNAMPRYDLVILLTKPAACSLHELTSKLTNAYEKYGGVTLSLHTSLKTKKLLLSGSLFFQRLLSSSAPIYESLKSTPFTVPAESSSVFMKAQKVFELYQIRAQDFLAAARLCFQAGLFSQTLFLLHQASEQALQALLESLTAKRISTHNITYLLRLSRRFSPLLHQVFEDPEGQLLLKTLQKAYLNAHYGPDFSGSVKDATDLLLRVEKLLLRLPKAFDSYLYP